jgi:hypothetical protein
MAFKILCLVMAPSKGVTTISASVSSWLGIALPPLLAGVVEAEKSLPLQRRGLPVRKASKTVRSKRHSLKLQGPLTPWCRHYSPLQDRSRLDHRPHARRQEGPRNGNRCAPFGRGLPGHGVGVVFAGLPMSDEFQIYTSEIDEISIRDRNHRQR